MRFQSVSVHFRDLHGSSVEIQGSLRGLIELFAGQSVSKRFERFQGISEKYQVVSEKFCTSQ